MKHPNLLWEVRCADGRVVSCLLESGASTHAVVQYVDEVVSNVEEFDDVRAARDRERALYTELARGPRERPAGTPAPSVGNTDSYLRDSAPKLGSPPARQQRTARGPRGRRAVALSLSASRSESGYSC
jgi:hypothetical protein